MKTNLLEILIVILLGFMAWNQWNGQRTDPAPAAAQQPVIIVQPAQQQPAAQSSVPVNVGDLSAQQPVAQQQAVSGTNTPGPTLNEVMGLPEGGNPFTGETP